MSRRWFVFMDLLWPMARNRVCCSEGCPEENIYDDICIEGTPVKNIRFDVHSTLKLIPASNSREAFVVLFMDPMWPVARNRVYCSESCSEENIYHGICIEGTPVQNMGFDVHSTLQ